MSDNNKILKQLRENNPFSSSISPLPWENNNPDLAQLNRETSEEIEQLIRTKRRQPDLPLAGLILGEAGSGKTHMLMRILRRLRRNARPAVFVAVKTFRDYKSVTQHLLSEIFISLKRIHSNGRSHFDMIAGEVMNVYEERRRNDGFNDISKTDPRIYLTRDMPKLDRNFLKCLLMYMGTNDEIIKSDILDWLTEGLEDDESLRLGLPSRDMNSMDESKRESMAEKTLISLGLILGYARIPVLICFDQLESIRDRELINAWGDLVSLLMNDLSGILPLCFVKPETWNDVFLPVLDSSVVQRLKNNTMIMHTCSLSQAKQLIHDRIANVFGEDAEEKYNFLMAKMNDTLKSGFSPRKVIELANHAITSKEPESEAEHQDEREEIYRTINNVYINEYKKVQDEPDNWPPNSDNLALALNVWLNSYDDFKISSGDGKVLKFIGIYGGKKFAFVIVIPRGHVVASAGLKRGMRFIHENPGSSCFYISENRMYKRTWRQVNENMKMFESVGGQVVMLDRTTRTSWYALAALVNRIDNGDVNLYLPSGNRTATRKDIKDFVRNIRLLNIDILPVESKTINTGSASGRLENEILTENMKAVIGSSPMNIIAIDKAIENLERRKIMITRDELINFLKRNNADFRTFQSKNNDILITFAVRE